MFKKDDAVIVVDYQNDFLPGGALGVTGGDTIAVAINRLIHSAPLVIATRDWHPPHHSSFSFTPKYEDGSWPEHCVANTWGSEISGALDKRYITQIFDKGTVLDKEAYSGFEGTYLKGFLMHKEIKRVFICGLALDYCVQDTAIDALKLGFEVIIVEDATKAVDPDVVLELKEVLPREGIKFMDSLEVIRHD